MLAHDEVWTAIDNLAERNGLSPSGLARRSGLDPTTFNKSKRYAPDGRPRWPSTESIAKILRATKTSITELFGEPQLLEPADGIAVPLLGDAHAGFDAAGVGGDVRADAPSPPRIITFPDRRFDPLYALRVVGDSMKPLYRDGDVLFISTGTVPEPGDRVVVKLKTDEVLVKILKEKRADVLAFHAVNPEHPDAAFDPDDVEWVAKIVYATQ